MLHSPRFLPFISGFALFFVTACADTELPKWLSGEPTKEEINAYQGPITMPDVNAPSLQTPNLGSIPARPSISSGAEQDKLAKELRAENARGEKAVTDYVTKASAQPAKAAKKPAAKHKKKSKTGKKKGTAQ